MTAPHAPPWSFGGDMMAEVVSRSQPADAVGQALRRAFDGTATLSTDMQVALDRLDRMACAHH